MRTATGLQKPPPGTSELIDKVVIVLRHVTRSRLIQIWLAAAALAIVAALGLGATMTVSTALLLLALALAPVVILLMLWPGVQAPSAGDVIRGQDQLRR